MKKNFLQDVIPPTQKRSIRDIPLPNNKRHKKAEDVEINNEKESLKEEGEFYTNFQKPVSSDVRPKNNFNQDVKIHQEKIERPTPPPTPPSDYDNHVDDFDFGHRPSKRKWFYVVGVLVLLIGFLILNNPKAEVVLYPKIENVFIQKEYDIYDKTLKEEVSGLGYKIMKIEKEATVNVEASGTEEVSEKASGTIKIINNYSEKEQKLVENTRFETEKGLVYRISESVTVPGYTENNGQITPGEVEAQVFADETGEKYNIGNTKFTIPGFKGFPQYEKMYAESVTDITGGFVGEKKVVSESDKEVALENLKKNIQSQIQEEKNNTSDEFVIVFKSDETNYSKLTENDIKDGVQLKLIGSIDAYVFPVKEIARYVANIETPNSSEGEVIISNKDEINFSIKEVLVEGLDGEGVPVEKLEVDGELKLEWIIDTDSIISQITGKNKSELTNIISGNKNIVKAESKIKPMWRNTFPKESKIEVIIQK